MKRGTQQAARMALALCWLLTLATGTAQTPARRDNAPSMIQEA
jgi:hypothetical protein